MTAFFFGPPEAQLFGYHHDARFGASGAAILCAPWGREYQFSHRAMRVLGRRLAATGVHALRFDYRGTGDSWGDTTDGSVSRWIEDTACAVDEVRTRTGVDTVHLIGLRVGALFAAAHAAREARIGKLVMWDPVPDAAVWADLLTQPQGSWRDSSEPTVELDGLLVAQSLLTELPAYTFANVATALMTQGPEGPPTLVLETAAPDAALSSAMRGWDRATLQHVHDEAPWREDPSIWSGLVPSKAIATIVDWVAT